MKNPPFTPLPQSSFLVGLSVALSVALLLASAVVIVASVGYGVGLDMTAWWMLFALYMATGASISAVDWKTGYLFMTLPHVIKNRIADKDKNAGIHTLAMLVGLAAVAFTKLSEPLEVANRASLKNKRLGDLNRGPAVQSATLPC
ncbi:MAG TPA: hypothetical protein VEZ89_03400 [Rubrivivax sp.]|nr:hypothetical protein [Rubrivivax sp.]